MSVQDFSHLPKDADFSLQELTQQAAQAKIVAETQLKSYQSQQGGWLWLSDDLSGQIPDWAARQIEITMQLENKIHELESQDRGGEISENQLKILKDCKEVVKGLADKIDYSEYLKLVLPKHQRIDPTGLLKGEVGGDKIKKSRFEWNLNLGLLMNIYNKTTDPHIKKQLSFLAVNYLSKAASINIRDIGLGSEKGEQLEEMFSLGLLPILMTYHRESITPFEREIFLRLKNRLAPPLLYQPTLLDTVNIEDLFPISFSVVQDHDACAVSFEQAIVKHFDHAKNIEQGFAHVLERPILIDLSQELSSKMWTEGDKEKNQEFDSTLEKCAIKLNQAIDSSVELLKKSKPKLCIEEEKLKVFIRSNILTIARVEIKNQGVGILANIPVLNQEKFFECPMETSLLGLTAKDSSFSETLVIVKDNELGGLMLDFINRTGIRIGGVSAREKIFNFMNLKELISSIERHTGEYIQLVDYSVRGENVLYFKDKSDISKSKLFNRFLEKCSDETHILEYPQHAILGKSTINLLLGLLKETSEEKWQVLNSNSATREIVQTALFRITQHLSNAENNMRNFVKFTHAIELIHCEIATLLAIVSPFQEDDFQKIYLSSLKIIPDIFKENVSVGLTKSAMNTVAGIISAVQKCHPDAVKTYGEGSYFESAFLMGKKNSLQEVINNSQIESIDLYVGEFNHNVNIDLNHDEYRKGTVVEDVQALLKAKPKTEHLTVVVDSTIDYHNSKNIQTLLDTFKDEIKSGKLNFVFFRSGQKFDMLGMDNYYGAPYFIVNNGDKYWEPFNALGSHDVFKTDSLSQQWFSLVYKYSPQALDDYRKVIFDNTKKVLSQIPEKLKPGNNPLIKVCTIAKGSDEMENPCFIDIKILDVINYSFNKIEKMLAKKFIDKGLKIHMRGSFGFYHPNWNIIVALQGGQRNFRINVGLNPDEVPLFIEFFSDLAKDITENAKHKPISGFNLIFERIK